jgi:hypothetical protein
LNVYFPPKLLLFPPKRITFPAKNSVQLALQDSSQSDTSAVVSSLTRDLSPASSSRRDESASPLSLRYRSIYFLKKFQ